MQFLLHVMQIIGQNEKTSDDVSFMTKAVFSAVRRPEKGGEYRFGKRCAMPSKGRAPYSRKDGCFPCGAAGWRVWLHEKREISFAGRWGVSLAEERTFFAGGEVAGCARAAACGPRSSANCKYFICYFHLLSPKRWSQNVPR